MNPKRLLIGLSLFASALPALAQSTAPAPAPAEPVVVPQVDRRDVRLPRYPSNDVEIGLYTGVYATENFGTSWVYGARVGYHLTEDFFVQGVYAQTKVTDEAFRQILPGGIFESKTQKLNYYNLSVGYNILPGEVFLFSSRARPSQFYIIGGVGSTKFVDQRKPTFNVGFGFKVFITDYVSWQLDLRDHIFTLDLLGKSQSTQNVELTTGLSFYF
jgi:outer membrane beta-barrel protein